MFGQMLPTALLSALLCLVTAGTNEVGTNEVGTNEVGTNEVGTNEVGLLRQVGTNEVGTNEVGTNEVGLPRQVGTNEVGTNEVGTNEVGLFRQVGTNEVGLKFLEENKNRPGVVTLPSGLQYKVLREGTGEETPTADSSCECHYAGTTPSLSPDAINQDESEWTEFDSSYKRGDSTSFAPNQVIKGWTEAMQLMVEGDKWEMYIPSEQGYGDGGSGEKIKGGDVLIFRMEILKIKGDKKPAERCDIESLKGCNDKQKKYVEKQQQATKDKRKSELERLKGMQGGQMKEDKMSWIVSRVNMLKKLVEKDEL